MVESSLRRHAIDSLRGFAQRKPPSAEISLIARIEDDAIVLKMPVEYLELMAAALDPIGESGGEFPAGR